MRQCGKGVIIKIFFILNPGEKHWSFGVLDVSKLEIVISDSMSALFDVQLAYDFTFAMRCLFLELKKVYPNCFVKDLSSISLQDFGTRIKPKLYRLQKDGNSCGPFTCLLLECHVKNWSYQYLNQPLVKVKGRIRLFLQLMQFLFVK